MPQLFTSQYGIHIPERLHLLSENEPLGSRITAYHALYNKMTT